MTLANGILVIMLGLLCWIGHSLVFFSPKVAQKFGLVEPREDLDETFYIIEVESLGLADLLVTWTFPIAGFLMIINASSWPWFAPVGGGTYLYMASAIILRRYYLIRHGKKVGRASSVKVAYFFGTLWLLSAMTMIVLAVRALQMPQ
jgi:hypothetical protein